jgi:hypothetical protein
MQESGVNVQDFRIASNAGDADEISKSFSTYSPSVDFLFYEVCYIKIMLLSIPNLYYNHYQTI